MTASLDRIRALHAGITPGPWRWDENYGEAGDTGLALTNDAKVEIVGAYNHHCCSFRDDPIVENDADAAFIAAAPFIVAQLLAVVERVEGLHFAEGDADHSSADICFECRDEWPCPTIQAITGEGSDG